MSEFCDPLIWNSFGDRCSLNLGEEKLNLFPKPPKAVFRTVVFVLFTKQFLLISTAEGPFRLGAGLRGIYLGPFRACLLCWGKAQLTLKITGISVCVEVCVCIIVRWSRILSTDPVPWFICFFLVFRLKCPYCPMEQSPGDAKQIFFWRNDFSLQFVSETELWVHFRRERSI